MRWKDDDLQRFQQRTAEWRKTGTVRTHTSASAKEVKHRRNKFGSRKTWVDGFEFHSQKEAHRWGVLKLMAVAGEITDLDRQVRFPLRVNRQEVCCYIADFTYRESSGGPLIVEDSKGLKTRDYIIKKKLMKAVHGIEIKET